MADLIQFDEGSGARIGRAVRWVEEQLPRARPLAFAKPLEFPTLLGQTGGGGGFRICTFSGSWTKDATKVVTYKYQTATPNTVTALNLFANIGTSTASVRNCAISREGTAWFLVAAEC